MQNKRLALYCFILTIILTMFFSVPTLANVSFNKTNLKDGVVGIQYSGNFNKAIRITVEKNNEEYTYSVKNNKLNYVPLQMGAGKYKVSVYRNVKGNKYKLIESEIIEINNINTNNMYTYSTFEVDFDNSMSSIKYYNDLLANKNVLEKVSFVYNDVVKNYSYDYAKANSVQSGYTPVIDEMYNSKKGICYDYSALIAGVLRSQGIPTKLVKGYSKDVNGYHSWNEVFMNGTWHIIDLTYDATMYQSGRQVTFSKDSSIFTTVKVY